MLSISGILSFDFLYPIPSPIREGTSCKQSFDEIMFHKIKFTLTNTKERTYINPIKNTQNG